jgi:hypothetical protein
MRTPPAKRAVAQASSARTDRPSDTFMVPLSVQLRPNPVQVGWPIRREEPAVIPSARQGLWVSSPCTRSAITTLTRRLLASSAAWVRIAPTSDGVGAALWAARAARAPTTAVIGRAHIVATLERRLPLIDSCCSSPCLVALHRLSLCPLRSSQALQDRPADDRKDRQHKGEEVKDDHRHH